MSLNESITIEVHATPGAKRNLVGGQHDGRLRVSVTAAADKGKANAAIIKLLADALGVSKSSIELISGATNRQKKFRITGASSDMRDKLQNLMQC
ncbi:DUF167 domain-containing protein [Stieleria varia]|uniref:UPF0235 protein Pla52n_17040 n=1 Tax=Stieleria varia TaxID=2528005 RepID=A0A5C6B256_9BACT|nr:DUF167 domain-containing protein [Stieleria varia]TWU05988.1 hypothetical protein Pla52n_17040 [Stieleria varia]